MKSSLYAKGLTVEVFDKSGEPIPVPVVQSFTAVPATVTAGASVLLSWATTNADTVTIDNGVGNQPANGSITVTPTANIAYHLTATGPGGTASATAAVQVIAEIPDEPIVVHKIVLNLYSMVMLDAQLQAGARYVRNQHHECLIADAVSMKFHWTSLAAGGSFGPLHFQRYSLWFGDLVDRGVQVAECLQTSGANTGDLLVGNLGTLPDGPYVARIFACETNGVEIEDQAVESMPPFGLWVDRHGEAKNHPMVIFQNSSYDWTHPEANGSQVARSLMAFVPKTKLKARVVPLVWSNKSTGHPSNVDFPGVFHGGTAFNTALPSNALTRLNFVPTSDAMLVEEKRPAITSRGIVVTENMQGYAAESNVFMDHPRLPMLDGPRGVATLYAPTAFLIGHAGSIYVLDNGAFSEISIIGDKTTKAGRRHKGPLPPYWEDMEKGLTPDIETVGTWDTAIPPEFRFPREGWSLDVDYRTTKQDHTVPPIEFPSARASLPPHPLPGPRFFATCFNQGGRLLGFQFDGTNFNGIPYCFVAIPNLKDPWGMHIGYDVFAAGDAVIFIAERGRHAISMWNADTYAPLGDLIINPNGANFGSVSATAQDRSWKFSAPYLNPNNTPKYDVVRRETILAPEGCWYDPVRRRVVWGALALGELRSIGIDNRDVEVCTRIPVTYGGQTKWIQVKGSDGSFGPQGTLFTTTFDNQTSGRPRAWLPGAGVDPLDGKPVTHFKQWAWQNEGRHIPRGPGGRSCVGIYNCGLGIGNGMLACGTSGTGVMVFMQATMNEALPDQAILDRGAIYYREQGHHLIHGNYEWGYVDEPLPWGENVDLDYKMRYDLAIG